MKALEILSAKKNILFIINPISGIGRQKRIERAIPGLLDHTIYTHEIRYSKYVNHAAELAAEAVRDGFDIVVAVGGDGTLGEVASGILHTSTEMAVIPAGSGNGMARELGIPRSLRGAFECINKGVTQTIDTARLNGNTFISTAGSGFDAHVANRFSVGQKRGLLRYALIVAREFLGYPSRKYALQIDGQEKIERFAWDVVFCNSKQFGNGAIVSPDSDVQDGMLNVVVVKDFPKYITPFMVLRLFTRSLPGSPYVEVYNCRSVSVEREKNNAIHLDGSPFKTESKLDVEIVPSSLKVRVPKPLRG